MPGTPVDPKALFAGLPLAARERIAERLGVVFADDARFSTADRTAYWAERAIAEAGLSKLLAACQAELRRIAAHD